jgi:hypothetical protein
LADKSYPQVRGRLVRQIAGNPAELRPTAALLKARLKGSRLER